MQEVYTEFKNTPAEFKMVYVEGGVFEIGSNIYDNETIHKVQVSSFWMGEFVVTQAVWKYVMAGTKEENPSGFKGTNRPVENISYEDILNEFLPKLNEIKGHPADEVYRLPTEAEWEYAAEGGKYGHKYPFIYAGSNKLEEVAWYDKNSHRAAKEVGLKTPNLLGLYDMSGNVWEWCRDRYTKGDYKMTNEHVIDYPMNPNISWEGVYRGGSWRFNALSCRFKHGNYYCPNYDNDGVGFRLVLSSFS